MKHCSLEISNYLEFLKLMKQKSRNLCKNGFCKAYNITLKYFTAYLPGGKTIYES